MECTKINCPMQAGTTTDHCGDNCPWRTTAKDGDLISRAALLHILNEQAPKPTTDDLYTVNLCIINAPAVDAAPVVHGRWVRQKGSAFVFKCSACGFIFAGAEIAKYCPHCGAKMSGDVVGKTAPDRVDVVRCRDCKEWHPCEDGECGTCDLVGGLWEARDFCSEGERKGATSCAT